MYKLLRQKTGKTTPVRTNGTVTYREQKMEGVRLDELLPMFQAFLGGGGGGGGRRAGIGTHKTLAAVQQEIQLSVHYKSHGPLLFLLYPHEDRFTEHLMR